MEEREEKLNVGVVEEEVNEDIGVGEVAVEKREQGFDVGVVEVVEEIVEAMLEEVTVKVNEEVGEGVGEESNGEDPFTNGPSVEEESDLVPIVEVILPTRTQKKKTFLPSGVAKIQSVRSMYNCMCTVTPKINFEVVNLYSNCISCRLVFERNNVDIIFTYWDEYREWVKIKRATVT